MPQSQLLASRRTAAPARSSAGRPAAASDSADEPALLAAACAGDRSAIATILGRHERAVRSFLRARLVEPSDADDLCQEVFVRALGSQVRPRAVTLLRPWLLGTARNVLREHVRRVVRRRETGWTELCLELDALTQPPPGGAADLADEAFDAAMGRLPFCLESLGPSAREAITSYYRGHLRLAQIGERMRRSEGAVKLLLHRARRALRYCLDVAVNDRAALRASAAAPGPARSRDSATASPRPDAISASSASTTVTSLATIGQSTPG